MYKGLILLHFQTICTAVKRVGSVSVSGDAPFQRLEVGRATDRRLGRLTSLSSAP